MRRKNKKYKFRFKRVRVAWYRICNMLFWRHYPPGVIRGPLTCWLWKIKNGYPCSDEILRDAWKDKIPNGLWKIGMLDLRNPVIAQEADEAAREIEEFGVAWNFKSAPSWAR